MRAKKKKNGTTGKHQTGSLIEKSEWRGAIECPDFLSRIIDKPICTI